MYRRPDIRGKEFRFSRAANGSGRESGRRRRGMSHRAARYVLAHCPRLGFYEATEAEMAARRAALRRVVVEVREEKDG